MGINSLIWSVEEAYIDLSRTMHAYLRDPSSENLVAIKTELLYLEEVSKEIKSYIEKEGHNGI